MPDCCTKEKEVDHNTAAIEGLKDRIFVDNGKPCIQSRINSLEKIAKKTKARARLLEGSVTAIVVGVIGKLIYRWVTQ